MIPHDPLPRDYSRWEQSRRDWHTVRRTAKRWRTWIAWGGNLYWDGYRLVGPEGVVLTGHPRALVADCLTSAAENIHRRSPWGDRSLARMSLATARRQRERYILAPLP